MHRGGLPGGLNPARIAVAIAGLAVAATATPVTGAWEGRPAENPDAVAYASIHQGRHNCRALRGFTDVRWWHQSATGRRESRRLA